MLKNSPTLTKFGVNRSSQPFGAGKVSVVLRRIWRPTCASLAVLVMVLGVAGCAGVDLRPEEIAELGRFTSLAATPAMRGVVVAVPHAELAPQAVAVARRVHESAGTGLVVAQGFMGAHSIAVTLPAEGRAALYRDLAHTRRARGVYHEYVRALRQAAGGDMGLYIELREAAAPGEDLQIATVGVTRDEAARIKALHLGTLNVRVEPIDALTYDPWGTKHDGVLLLPPKGLSILMPSGSAVREDEVARWLQHVVRNLGPVPVETTGRPAILDRGRFSVLKRSGGIVVAAPHGSGDWQSDYMAELIAEHLAASLVVVHGFMGTREQTWRDRIAVNRPLEGPGMHSEDRFTSEAEVVYRAYWDHVKALTTWPPALYIEVHTNSHINARGAIEVATVGISNAEALRIKAVYQQVAERVLGRRPEVELRIEGADPVFMNAYGNKLVGILSKVPRALHIEFPAQEVMRDRGTRRAYRNIMAEVLQHASSFLLPFR